MNAWNTGIISEEDSAQSGGSNSIDVMIILSLTNHQSKWKMPSGKEKDHQRRGYPVCYVNIGIWQLCGASETVFTKIQGGEWLK